MNEVKHIHIGRQQFTVSVEAYTELKEYLEAVTKQAGETGADVAEEVELRMAELLTQRGITEHKVILPKDVKFLKGQLGEPSDFSEGEAKTEAPKPEGETSRRLFRDTDNAMIAGVAAGLAEYLDIDPIIIRIIFIALTFTAGSGVLIYVLLWLLVPEARTSTDRLSMQGKAAMVDNLKQLIKRADVPGAARRGGNIIAKSLRLLGTVFLFVVGLPLAIGSGLAILGTMAMGTFIVLDGFKVAGHVVAPIGSHEVAGFVGGVVTILCILMLMLLAGIAMMRRRWQLPAWGVAALLGVFFLSAAVGGAFAADTEPTIQNRVEALQHTQTVTVPVFSSVTLNGPETNFSYVPDGKDYVRYQYWGSAHLDKLKSTVTKGKLVVDTNGADPYICSGFCSGVDPGIRVEIHGPKLTSLVLDGQQFDLRQPCDVTDSADMSVDCPPVPTEPAPVLKISNDN